MKSMNFVLATVLVACPVSVFAAKGTDPYVDLDKRRSRVDDYIAKERLRVTLTSENVMARSQMKDLLKEIDLELSYLEAGFKPDANAGSQQLKEAIGELKRSAASVKKHPYCLGYNTTLLSNLNSVLFLAVGMGVIDVRTLTALNGLTNKETKHVGGLAAIFEQELLYSSAKTQ